MNHWGWYWKYRKKHEPKTLCSQLLNLDSFKILKKEITGFYVTPKGLNAQMIDGSLKVSHGKNNDYAYTIHIDRLPCHYGGFRPYFRCPNCQKRMRILYLMNESLRCRRCLNLGYLSQRLRPSDRYLEAQRKIRDLIKQKGGDVSESKKPLNMRKKTFEKLMGRSYSYERMSHQALNAELREWYGKKADPYLEECFELVSSKLKVN